MTMLRTHTRSSRPRRVRLRTTGRRAFGSVLRKVDACILKPGNRASGLHGFYPKAQNSPKALYSMVSVLQDAHVKKEGSPELRPA